MTNFLCSFVPSHVKKIKIIKRLLDNVNLVIVSSFFSKKFWLFSLFRCFVGVGQSSFSCLAASIIGDLFTNNEKRSKILAIFYLAIPIGSGLSFVLSSKVSELFGDWRWALRMTPLLSLICVILLTFLVKEPQRSSAFVSGKISSQKNSSLFKDILFLIKK